MNIIGGIGAISNINYYYYLSLLLSFIIIIIIIITLLFSETTERAVLGELEQDQTAAIKRDNEEAVDEQGRLTSRVRMQTFFASINQKKDHD